MKILWISSLAWKSEKGYSFPVDGPGAVSGSLFQQTLINQLEKQGCEVDIVSDYPYSSNTSLFHKGYKWQHKSSAHDVTIKSINNSLISLITKKKYILNAISQLYDINKYDFVISYLVHQPYLSSLAFLKKKYPNIKTILICPDLPNMMDMSLNNKKIKSVLKKIDLYRINKLYSFIDGYVLFTECMKEKIPVKNKNYTVIEGIASLDDLDIKTEKKNRAIMHAGTLHKNIGIENIIEALCLIPESKMELWFFGDGELKEYILKKAKLDKRIKYFGFIEREKLFDFEKKATALINARDSKDEYTKYSFPSKTFEYMYSGTPYITTWLDGMPLEYKEYFILLKDNSPKEIAKAILDVESGNYDESISIKAQQFVKKEKSGFKQAEKLINLMKNIDNDFFDGKYA